MCVKLAYRNVLECLYHLIKSKSAKDLRLSTKYSEYYDCFYSRDIQIYRLLVWKWLKESFPGSACRKEQKSYTYAWVRLRNHPGHHFSGRRPKHVIHVKNKLSRNCETPIVQLVQRLITCTIKKINYYARLM